MTRERLRIDRRGFLGRLLAFVAGALGLAGCQTAPRLTIEPGPPLADDRSYMTASEEEIVRAVEEAFPFLRLDPEGVTAFARDLVRLRESGALKPLPFLDVPRRFLLSSSFFDDGADESKRVEYLMFHDPYVTPCSNRLAQAPPS